MVSDGAATRPIALEKNQGEALWFVASLAIIKAAGEMTNGRVTVFEILAPEGAGSPLHVHHREDEWFYILEGEMTFWVGGRVIEVSAGSFIYGPRDIPHTYIVRSPQALYLGVEEPAGFEKFMRAVGQPAKTLTIPPPSTHLPDQNLLASVASEFGMEILGPPGIPTT
ncbi:putative Cupin 2 [Hyphomicrobium denitrificans 1NES1]|uniref:Putative Cupin 2 n=1 Tax=Hyphomicrobium denitrificans 1NES1 TaxID=670307 RepID=N0B7T4_9HYPH|nr:quercetin 2,3-dioxygenase [Hyphomicrobium denitrificans]AGK58322.1 putative Cupin 2 [Hyphomicrobium denitrificans 1NES1]